MSEEHKELDDSNSSDEFLPEDLDSDWGEAWESAFEAEDDALTTGPDAQDDFFLDEDEGTTGAPVSSPTSEASPSPSAASPETPTEPSTTGQTLAFASVLSHSWRRLSDLFFSKLFGIPTALLQRYNALQSKQKIMLGGGIAVMVCLVAIWSFLSGPDDSLPDFATSSPDAQKVAVGPSPDTKKAEVAAAPQEEVVALLPEKVRKKWVFPAFFIPVVSQSGDKAVNFVVIDLTLIAVLDKDEELPEDKKAFVRDVIYQFYINRPLFELRRYSLARGDMSRELRAWLHKQWPDGPIEAIIFNKYHLT